jgi:hypothetical protein
MSTNNPYTNISLSHKHDNTLYYCVYNKQEFVYFFNLMFIEVINEGYKHELPLTNTTSLSKVKFFLKSNYNFSYTTLTTFFSFT